MLCPIGQSNEKPPLQVLAKWREYVTLQIQEWFKKSIFSNTEQLTAFWKAFEEGNMDGVEMYLNRIMSNSISVFDIKTRTILEHLFVIKI